MLKLIDTTFLGLLAIVPGIVLSACGDDDAIGPGTGAANSGGSSSSAGEPGAAGEVSGVGAASASGGSSGEAGDGASAGEGFGDVIGLGGANSEIAPVDLGSAINYAVLAKSEITNVPTSKLTGDLGLSPAAASYITGFGLTKAGTSWTSPQVVGSVFAANNDPPTPTLLTTAVKDMLTAYSDAAGRTLPDHVELGAGAIGGKTLRAGLYKWTSTVNISSDVTIAGDEDDVWIFQISGDLKLAAAKAMILSGGAQPAHVFWQVAGLVELGTTSHTEGIVLCKTAIGLQTGASINGRLLAQTAVNLAKATVTAPQ